MEKAGKESLRKLVVYYSLDGNTRLIAETIARAVGADILELRLKNEVKSGGLMKYFRAGRHVFLREKPELLPFDKNPEDYHVLFMGSPVWAFSYAPALRTFFSQVKIKDKKVALFCCYGGAEGKTFVNMKKALSGNEILGTAGFLEPLRRRKEKNVAKARTWAEGVVSGL